MPAITNYFLKAFYSLFICLPIIMLPMTLLWSHGACIVSCLVCLIVPILFPNVRNVGLKLHPILYGLFFFFLAHHLLSEDISISFEESTFYFTYILYFLHLIRVFRAYPELKKSSLIAVASSFLYPIIGFIHMWLTVDNLNDLSWVGLMPGFANVRFSAHLAYACLLICCYLMDISKALKGLLLWGIGSSVIMGYMLFGGSRAPLLALMVYLIMVSLWDRSNYKRFLSIWLSVILGGVLFSSFFPVDRDSYSRMYSSFARADANEISSNRLEIWTDGIKLITEKPLLGHSVDTFRYHTDSGDRMCHPHNTIVQITHDYGLLGLCIFVGFVAFLVQSYWKKYKEKSIEKEDVFYVSFLLTYFIYSLFTGISYYVLPMLISIFFIAIAMSRMNIFIENSKCKNLNFVIEKILLIYALFFLIVFNHYSLI